MHCDPSSRPAGPQSGLTLIDVLGGIAVSVLLVGSAMTGVASHQTQRRIHGERLMAMAACRSTFETLRSVDVTELPSYDGRGFDVPGPNGEPRGLNPVADDADGLAGEIAVVRELSNGIDTLYSVTVAVRWRGATPGGSISMTMLMGERR